MNVQQHGYLVVLLNAALVAALFLGIGAGAVRLDQRLFGVRSR